MRGVEETYESDGEEHGAAEEREQRGGDPGVCRGAAETGSVEQRVAGAAGGERAGDHVGVVCVAERDPELGGGLGGVEEGRPGGGGREGEEIGAEMVVAAGVGGEEGILWVLWCFWW